MNQSQSDPKGHPEWWSQEGVIDEKLVDNKLIQLVRLSLNGDCPFAVIDGTIFGSTVCLDDMVAFPSLKRAYQLFRSKVRQLLRNKFDEQKAELAKAQALFDGGDTIGATLVLMGEKPVCKMCEQTSRNGLGAWCRKHAKAGSGAFMFVMVNSLSLLSMWRLA